MKEGLNLLPDQDPDRPAGLRARKLARTRKQILIAAIEAFTARGYQGTTLDQVAEAADVHRRTLLRYFPTKAHLVLDRQYAALAEFRKQCANAAGQTIFDIWSDHVLTHARKLAEGAGQIRILEIAATEPALRQAFVEIQEQYREIITEALEIQFGMGFGPRIRARVVADALVAGNFSVAKMMIADGADPRQLEAAEREVLRLVKEGLLGE